MSRVFFVIVWCLLWLGVPKTFGQFGETPINTFGYFQVSFQHSDGTTGEHNDNSFSIQQLNLILESNLSLCSPVVPPELPRLLAAEQTR